MERIDAGALHDLHDIVVDLVALKREGSYWDFKREWHSSNESLLHDIICLANNLEQDTSYLVIGIDEEHDYAAVDVADNEKRKNTQELTDFITKVSWFGGMWPDACVETIRVDGKMVDVVVISARREHVPYALAKQNGKLRPYAVHTRRNDTNTPIDGSATFAEAEALWRRHFGLDRAPIDRLPRLLENRADWVPRSQTGDTEVLYHRHEPEFAVDRERDRDDDAYEYYMFGQRDARPLWYTVRVLYKGEQIFDDRAVALDGGRYFTIAPRSGRLPWRVFDPLEYCYLVKGTLEWSLHRFLFRDGDDAERVAHDRFMESILVFESEDERSDFGDSLKRNRDEFEERVSRRGEPLVLARYEGRMDTEVFATEIKRVNVLREMLDEYRSGRMHDNLIAGTSRDW